MWWGETDLHYHPGLQQKPLTPSNSWKLLGKFSRALQYRSCYVSSLGPQSQCFVKESVPAINRLTRGSPKEGYWGPIVLFLLVNELPTLWTWIHKTDFPWRLPSIPSHQQHQRLGTAGTRPGSTSEVVARLGHGIQWSRRNIMSCLSLRGPTAKLSSTN